MNTPKIFVWCAGSSGEANFHHIQAIAEDGSVLAGHACSSHAYISNDMGFTSDWKHDRYNEHYPNGWQLELVERPKEHSGFQSAQALKQQQAEAI